MADSVAITGIRYDRVAGADGSSPKLFVLAATTHPTRFLNEHIIVVAPMLQIYTCMGCCAADATNSLAGQHSQTCLAP